jgi:hypothetical protein
MLLTILMGFLLFAFYLFTPNEILTPILMCIGAFFLGVKLGDLHSYLMKLGDKDE